jgi:PPOX class probable F420-dependent enzyme
MAYQYSDMDQDQIEAFLEAPRVAIFGTNRVKGPPQLTPVWYLYENGRIYISMFVRSAKYRNLCRDPSVAICIAGDHSDARAVMLYGSVNFVSAGAGDVDQITWKLMRRYYESDEEARAFMASWDPGEESALAVLEPDKIIAQDFN